MDRPESKLWDFTIIDDMVEFTHYEEEEDIAFVRQHITGLKREGRKLFVQVASSPMSCFVLENKDVAQTMFEDLRKVLYDLRQDENIGHDQRIAKELKLIIDLVKE